jgi:hypothetical protein
MVWIAAVLLLNRSLGAIFASLSYIGTLLIIVLSSLFWPEVSQTGRAREYARLFALSTSKNSRSRQE